MPERLQKWLAGLGFGSRRQIEAWIADGRVTVDGKPAVLGQKVTGDERIKVNGQPVRQRHGRSADPKVIIYHKPVGELCTRSDPEGRPTVFAALPRLHRERWIGVGRLDLQTAGLLLLTTDGELAHRLMHPSAGLEREYAVRIQGEADAETLTRLRQGIELEDGPARFDLVEFSGGEASNRWYRVVVTEGRNRVVRRLWEAAGLRVSRLIRTRYGPIGLPRRLLAGRSQNLPARDVRKLYQAVGLKPVPGGKAVMHKKKK